LANLRDRVKVSTATTGTGTITLGSLVPGYRAFSSAYAADTVVSYAIEDGTAWETGIGTYSNSASTLTRAFDASSTGALLNLSGSATVAVAFLSRDNVGDWPFLEVVQSSGAGGTDGAFTTIRFNTVVSDTHAGWDSTNNIYTIPQDGTYDAMVKFRISDGTRTGKSYGLGVNTTNTDFAGFTWYQGSPSRQGAEYRRLSPFKKGDLVRAYFYMDAVGAGYATADFALMRVR
jgi:hypothetical protein